MKVFLNKVPKINERRKNNISQNISWHAIFLKLQCLLDDLVDFLVLSMFLNTSLP